MVDKEKVRENVKILLGIQDGVQDAVLDILINHADMHFRNLLKQMNPLIKEVPDELSYILEEVVIRRFNRLGSEGMQSESVEGHSVTYKDWREDFSPYWEVLEGYRADDGGSGKVIFI